MHLLIHNLGELVFLSALGKHILLVSSFKAANDLFEKRSLNYSDRFQSPMSFDLWVHISISIQFPAYLNHDRMGWDFSFAHMMYGRWFQPILIHMAFIIFRNGKARDGRNTGAYFINISSHPWSHPTSLCKQRRHMLYSGAFYATPISWTTTCASSLHASCFLLVPN